MGTDIERERGNVGTDIESYVYKYRECVYRHNVERERIVPVCVYGGPEGKRETENEKQRNGKLKNGE